MHEPYAQVLIVEDDPSIGRLLQSILLEAGYKTEVTNRGDLGLDLIRKGNHDLVILDVNLPRIDGLTVCREVRKFSQTPILMLSSKDEPFDKVLGLEVGADDYLAKPFDPRELVARLRALLRRPPVKNPPSGAADSQVGERLSFGPFEVDTAGHTVTVGESSVHLTFIEFSLLALLLSRTGRVQTRRTLIEEVWGHDYPGDERTVDVHIRHLRQKLREHDPKQFIVAVRGVGYKFECP